MPLLPISQISISSPITIIPKTATVSRYYHQGVFYIYVNNWSGIESVNLLLLYYTSMPGTERAHQPSQQPSQSQYKNKIKEKKACN
jgi:hypothetical protein